jgi:hypothetical protein
MSRAMDRITVGAMFRARDILSFRARTMVRARTWPRAVVRLKVAVSVSVRTRVKVRVKV